MSGDIFDKVRAYCEDKELFSVGDGVIVGLSGGADSVFLLLVLSELRCHWDLRLEALHINHGIRGEEARRDEAFSVTFAEELGISCQVRRAQIPVLAREWGMTEEEAGRVFRYRCLEERRQELGFQKIAVAHHRDDQAETILFQLLRGSSLRGMGGMRPKRGCIVRPLLEIMRLELEAYLEQQDIPYCVDSTNEQDTYARNKIRHYVLPYLQEQIQPAAVQHIAQTGTYLQEVMDYLDMQCEATYNKLIVRQGSRLVMEQGDYRELPELLKRELLLRMIQELAGQRKDIIAVHIGLIQSVFAGETGKSVMLPYRLRAERAYDRLYLYVADGEEVEADELNEPLEPQKEYCFLLDRDRRCKITFERVSGENLSNRKWKKHCTKCFDYDKMNSMPIFRYPQAGDFLWLDAAGRTKKLSRMFIDAKVEREQRKRTVVLAEGHHILWVPALDRCSAYYYISEDTREAILARVDVL